ncbi:MAG: hypothetical protein J6B45_02500 [Clostridia bacterium]|nr:hypothetical protein [Clostridia bacterium]
MAKYQRVPLNVDALFLSDGTIKPRKIILKDEVFTIDKVISHKNYCPRVVPCVAPVEYTVTVEGVSKKIYYEPHSNMWFSVKRYEK